MNTIHICKSDPLNASRIQMQLKWESGECIVLGKWNGFRPHGVRIIDKVQYHRLTIHNLIKVLKYRSGAYIFHQQSSLPYLFVALLWRAFMRAKICITYDMHDLNEAKPGLNYIYLRYLFFYFLEYLITKSAVNIVTVSGGLATILRNRYKVKKPIQIVYSIPTRIEHLDLTRRNNVDELLYFGLIVSYRVTKNLLDCIKRFNLKLHLYGYIPFGAKETKVVIDRFERSGTAKYMGKYKPEEMNFLKKYMFSIIDYSTADSCNVRHCLPNKLFQSIRYGLICLISTNLSSARELFKNFPWFVVPICEKENLAEICTRVKQNYNETGINDINDYLDQLESQSKHIYLSSISGNLYNNEDVQ